MPTPSEPLLKLGFLTLGIFDPAEPASGHESTLSIIELGEQLGFDSVWLRHRHLQHGISSPIAVMAAASQRTSRIEFGTAVTPLAWENPFRLAEDLATVDVLSGGRVNPGVSTGTIRHFEELKQSLYPDTADIEDFGYERVERLLRLLRGEPASSFSGVEGIEVYSERIEPHSKGLANRVWYGTGSLGSAQWAGEHGLNLLISSVAKSEGPLDFAHTQLAHISTFRAHHPQGDQARVSQGLVVIPTDTATPEQRDRYRAYAESRMARTSAPQGPAKIMFSPDLVGTSDELAEQLYAHAAFREVNEVSFALPFTFEHEDYVQILVDIATELGPKLNWKPAVCHGSA